MGARRSESYYVNKLCSPTRTALLSGRYAYTNGQDDGVIVDGQDIDMPLNLLTIADRLQAGGWNTSAYGKWDAGCTVWGSTPTCRGFDHFNGFCKIVMLSRFVVLPTSLTLKASLFQTPPHRTTTRTRSAPATTITSTLTWT